MSNVVSSPAVIRSRIPRKARTAKVPVIAQAAINAMLSKQAGALMNYYMTETDGFAPAAQTVYMYTGLKKPKMIAARKELAEKRFIDFKKDSNEIVILWDRILECGEVAVRLADCPGCNVKETMQGGEFYPQQAPTMRELMNEVHGDDPEKRKREPHAAYVKAGLDKLERLTEEEFQRWLRTGCAYPSDLPDDPNYVPPVEDSIDWDPDDVMGTKTPSGWIEGEPNDQPDGWRIGDEMNEELGF